MLETKLPSQLVTKLQKPLGRQHQTRAARFQAKRVSAQSYKTGGTKMIRRITNKKGQGKSIRRLALTSILKQNTLGAFRPPVIVTQQVSAKTVAAL